MEFVILIVIPLAVLGLMIWAMASSRRARRRADLASRSLEPELGFGELPFDISDLLGDLSGAELSWSSTSYTWDRAENRWVRTSSSSSFIDEIDASPAVAVRSRCSTAR